MEISIHKKLNYINDYEQCKKKQGRQMADVIARRFANLRAATVLEDLRNLPGRHHELGGKRKGQFAADLIHPKRLIYSPDHELEVYMEGNAINWSKITKIKIIEIIDYH